MSIEIRPLDPEEIPFVKEMMYEALFVRPGQAPFPRDILERPELAKYIADWGRHSYDQAIVALSREQLVGAVWGRLFSAEQAGYGFIDEHTPEITIAIKKEFRAQAIGTLLLQAIEIPYLEMGVPALSLSVDQLSPAIALYLRSGYQIHEEIGTAYTMRKALS
ncbi:MAG: GNAT family N-acetyltransferase [Bacteroidota bacterium]